MNDNQISPDTTQVQAVADKVIPEGSQEGPSEQRETKDEKEGVLYLCENYFLIY